MRNIAICTYRVKESKEVEFLGHLAKHWPMLRRLELVNEQPHFVFRGVDESKKVFFVEIVAWRSPEGPDIAEQTPEVMAVWEPMGRLCEARLGRPPMEFPHVEQVAIEPDRES